MQMLLIIIGKKKGQASRDPKDESNVSRTKIRETKGNLESVPSRLSLTLMKTN